MFALLRGIGGSEWAQMHASIEAGCGMLRLL